MENKSLELNTAILAAKEAGKMLKDYFDGEFSDQEIKDDSTIVTVADKKAEEIIKGIILDSFPNHSILGEEEGLVENSSEYVWHVDPVDGTRNFANGIPLYCVSIALEKDSEIIVGVVYNPSTDRMFYAEKGFGTWLNDKKVSVSGQDHTQGMFTIGSGRKEEDLTLKIELLRNGKTFVRSVRDFGCTALELAYLASGGTEAFILLGLNTYDFAAGVFLVEEAGGRITNLDGSKWYFPDNYFLASNGVFHEDLLENINKLRK
ncbi:MAG: myo-inositol-1(or 4)-monophosphatase [Candidatus Paceibacteria bacterium]|jgi:myo-inositol-1(or 4)-monophosphatase